MILDEIVSYKRAHRPPKDVRERAEAVATPVRSLAAALRAGRKPRAIAEFKRRSPSAGAIRPDARPELIAREYQAAGAAALSILTDEKWFDGAPEHLRAAREAAGIPVIRKDFLIDEDDVAESRLLGADAVLLIVRILPRERLRAMLEYARALGMEALVETHSSTEIATALEAGAQILGVNHRDLDTLAIDLSLSARARAIAGPEVLLVAESGIATRADVARMREHGVDAILVGEALMRAPSPGAALAELLQ